MDTYWRLDRERIDELKGELKMVVSLVVALDRSLVPSSATVASTLPAGKGTCVNLSARDENNVRENIRLALEYLEKMPQKLKSVKKHYY